MSEVINQEKGLSLIEKGKKGFFHMIFSRLGLMLLLLVIQVLLLFNVFRWFGNILPYIWGGSILFSVIMVLYLLNSRMDATAKITWLIVIMLMPVFGALLYWYTMSDVGHRAMKTRVNHLIQETKDSIPQSETVMETLEQENPGVAGLARYVNRSACCPIYDGTKVTYFPLGEKKWEDMLRQLEGAKQFMFMEYFIVDEGEMWGRILEILARKAAEGVDVRVMYDGTCEFALLPRDYPERLKKLGIKCKVFAHVTPFVSTHYNNRDHRKILVIDGQVAFNGGVNLADEYVNLIQRFGHWKDTAVMIQGEAVKSFTLMFLQMWGITEKNPEFDQFLSIPVQRETGASGFVMPYGDSPMDQDKVGEKVYMDILNRARKYVYIMTPYLILDGELETALKFAAERGVEVKLVLPGIPDKKPPYALAKTHYASLLDSGVQICEYTPGFVHAKVFLSDGQEGVVGTINLDYRSLYHHFECATYFYKADCLAQMEEDFRETFAKCREVTRQTIKEEKLPMKLMGFLMKAVAPLL